MSSEEGSEVMVAMQWVVEVKSIASIEDPPMEEWSSLLYSFEPKNEKSIAYNEGLYSPGSGELCNKYIAMSDSSVFRHPYYEYPGVTDPGVVDALLYPERKKQYDDNGQELYLELCNEMGQCPVKLFHRNLLNETIDLKYYCIDPFNVRAMSMALYSNKTVKVLDLTDNFLNIDACFHLGEMLLRNTTLQELILNGCRIGEEGAKRILGSLTVNRSLIALDLSRNQLCDPGAEELAKAVDYGTRLQRICLRHDNITSNAAAQFAEALESHNYITHLDISWNNLYSPVGISNLINNLSENIEELHMTNNSLYGQRVANAIKNIIKAPNLSLLDISSNMFSDDDIAIIITYLNKAKKLQTFNLSTNPLSVNCAIQVLSKLKLVSVKIQYLLLDNIDVNQEFMTLLSKIKNLKSKKDAVITYGRVVGTMVATRKDVRDVILDRAEFLCNSAKKDKVDLAIIMMKCLKEKGKLQNEKDFGEYIKHSPLDNDLVSELINVFAGPSTKKARSINVWKLVEYVKRKWPDKALPPSPRRPSVPEPDVRSSQDSIEPGQDSAEPALGTDDTVPSSTDADGEKDKTTKSSIIF